MVIESSPRIVHFLLVEDNVDHADLVVKTFHRKRLQNTIDHVEDGDSALAYLNREGRYANAKRPDVVLLDLKLPGIDGLEVLERIKANDSLQSIPVVVLTTSEAERDRAQAYRRRANSYVVKPIDFTRLMEIVDHLQLYWGICNAPPAPSEAGNERSS